MEKTCTNPLACPGVKAQLAELQAVKEEIKTSNQNNQETQLHLVKVTAAVETQNKLLEVYRHGTGKDISDLFTKANNATRNIDHVEANLGITIAQEFGKVNVRLAEEIGKVNTSQAKKLGIWDVGRILGLITAALVLFGVLYTLYSG